jgi:hypothetical protein
LVKIILSTDILSSVFYVTAVEVIVQQHEKDAVEVIIGLFDCGAAYQIYMLDTPLELLLLRKERN